MAKTVLWDFSFDLKQIPSIDGIFEKLEKCYGNLISGGLQCVASIKLATDRSQLRVYNTQSGGVVLQFRLYETGLLTVTLEFSTDEAQHQQFNYEWCKRVCNNVGAVLDARRTHVVGPVSRGSFRAYYPSSDERLLEYDVDGVVFDETSPYQRIQIVHSKTLGNMLILDDLQNISEADLIYTETLMGRGTENYKDKEIVILGGGDGALLYELLKEEPKLVVMLEIDEIVMNACAQHMRSICGNVLDQRTGPNYQIIVGDCMQLLDEYISQGRHFDYVFGDLTDIPISSNNTIDKAGDECNLKTQELWQFVETVLEKSLRILKIHGKFMTHTIGAGSTEALRLYYEKVQRLQPSIRYTTSKAFVPSFMEFWCFCQIERLQ